MQFYIKQKLFSWGDRFSIYDVDGNELYFVEGEVFSFGKKLHLYDRQSRECAYIEQEVFTFKPRYHIYKGNTQIAQVVKEFSFFRDQYRIEGLDWQIEGDFFDHEYRISNGISTIASVSKEWFTFGDAYCIDIDKNVDTVSALAVVLVIDACIDAQRD